MSALCCYSEALPLWLVIIDLPCGCVCRLAVECGRDPAACGEAFAVWLCVQAGCGVWTGHSRVWRGICRVAVCAGWLWSVDGTQPRVERRLPCGCVCRLAVECGRDPAACGEAFAGPRPDRPTPSAPATTSLNSFSQQLLLTTQQTCLPFLMVQSLLLLCSILISLYE